MTTKPRYIHGRKQHVVDKALGVGDANGGDAHADSAECAVAGDDDRRRRVELHDVLHPQLDVVDEVAVGEMWRYSAVWNHGELQRVRRARTCEEWLADARWRQHDGVGRRRSSLGSNRSGRGRNRSSRGSSQSSRGSNRSSRSRGDNCNRGFTVGCDFRVGSVRVRAAVVTESVAVAAFVVTVSVSAAPAAATLLLLGAAVGVIVKVPCFLNYTNRFFPRRSKVMVPR